MNTILQISGFVAALVFLIIFYAVTGGHSAWPALFCGAFTVHFAGDWLASFLKNNLSLAGFNISQAVKPKAFTQFVGMMIALASIFLLGTGHSAWGSWTAFLGMSLALTGFVWDVIYP